MLKREGKRGGFGRPFIDSCFALGLNSRALLQHKPDFAPARSGKLAGAFFDAEAAVVRRRDWLIDEKIGSVIRMRRLKLGLTQADLGNARGVTFQQIPAQTL